ncbi:subclass B1 metallo-beta-lactamase [Aureivirga marina]|uniref:subclass B1 metallo-beta-lactamase n=1 Tax=Aureivirga marina TaxID=1182451 RepID=UPI0018CA5406|nr:subclass B1 metallo-beta-lactamase [Aureivirga marina]
MKKIAFLFLISIAFFSCTNSKEYASETLKIQPLSENIFTHISYLQTEDFGNVPCNGMIYIENDEAIIFDTPTNNKASEELINWVEKQNKTVKAIVVTHFHEDCLGGLEQFHQKNIASYGSEKTINLANEKNIKIVPNHVFSEKIELEIGKNSVITEYFGEGHTKDNVVGYIPNENALFGGCLVKRVGAGKGFTGDANINAWSNTVLKIKNKYPNLEIVVPGHGKSGGTELLDFTIELFKN